MKFTVDLSQVKVVARTDYKGNPVICLDLFGHYALYKDPEARDQENIDAEVDGLNSYVPSMVGTMLGEMLQHRFPETFREWMSNSPTGREVDYHDMTVQEADL